MTALAGWPARRHYHPGLGKSELRLIRHHESVPDSAGPRYRFHACGEP